MVEIRCPICAGMICKGTVPPIEGKCSSCHQISLFDGKNELEKARPMSEDEIRQIKTNFHNRRKANNNCENRM